MFLSYRICEAHQDIILPFVATVLKYFEEFSRASNAGIRLKDFFWITSTNSLNVILIFYRKYRFIFII